MFWAAAPKAPEMGADRDHDGVRCRHAGSPVLEPPPLPVVHPADAAHAPLWQVRPEIDCRGPEIDCRGPEIDCRGPEIDCRGPEIDCRGPEIDYHGTARGSGLGGYDCGWRYWDRKNVES
jgi:hypothetical protein